MDDRLGNLQRSYVLIRIDKQQNKSEKVRTISSCQNPVIAPPATCICQSACRPCYTEAICTKKVVLKEGCANEKLQDNDDINPLPEKDFLSLGRGDGLITNNGAYCDNKDPFYNYVTNNGNEIRQEQANKGCNCGTCCPKHDDRQQDQQAIDVSFANNLSRKEFSKNSLPGCIKTGSAEVISSSDCLTNRQPSNVCDNSKRQTGSNDREVEKASQSILREPWNSLSCENQDQYSRQLIVSKLSSSNLFKSSNSHLKQQKNIDNHHYQQAWEAHREILNLENQPTLTCLQCKTTPNVLNGVSCDIATVNHSMDRPSMKNSGSGPILPDGTDDERVKAVSNKPKPDETNAVNKIEEFKQKETAFKQTVLSHNLLQQHENTTSSVEFKTIRGNHSDGLKQQQTVTAKNLPNSLWMLNPAESEDSSNKESAYEKDTYSNGNLWSLNQFSRELLPTPPSSSMKKTRSIGSASKKQRVKFDLDVEVHVVPRDTHQPSPVEYNLSDQDSVNDFINNFEEDTDDSFSLFSQGSDKEVLGEYIPPSTEDPYDMRNAFGKLSINGSFSPFRVINKDDSPSGGRAFAAIPTGVYPGRRDSLDLIQMQQFLKQQAKERALSSSTSYRSAADKAQGQSSHQNNEQKSKQLLIPPSSPSVPLNQYHRKLSNPRHFKASSANENGRMSRYAHLQLQRQYDEWENRRQKKKRISASQSAPKPPGNNHPSSHALSTQQIIAQTNQPKNLNSSNVQQPKQFINRPASKLPAYLSNSAGANAISSGSRIQSASVISSQRNNFNLRPVRGFTPQRVRQSKMPSLLRSGTLVSNAAHTMSYASRSLPADNFMNRTYRPKTSDTCGTLPTKNFVELERRDNIKTYKDAESFHNTTEMFNFAKLFDGARSTLKDAHKINITKKSAKKLSEVDSSNFSNKSRITLTRNARSLREPLPSQNAVTLKTLGLTVHPPRRTGQAPNLSCIQLRKDDSRSSELSCLFVTKSPSKKPSALPSGRSMTRINSKPFCPTGGDHNDSAKSHELAKSSSYAEEHSNNRQSVLLLTPRIAA